MVAQYQQKVLERDGELGRTQDTLFELEKKFGHSQSQWRSEKESFNSEMKSALGRIKDLEETNKSFAEKEALMKELQAKCADYEDQIQGLDLSQKEREALEKQFQVKGSQYEVKIQDLEHQLNEGRAALEKELQAKGAEAETKIQGLEQKLSKSSEQLTKMKRQFQIKLKALKDENAKVSKEKESEDSTATSSPTETEVKLANINFI